jgi:hypothetical protein
MVPVADADWRFVPREDLIAFSTTTLVPSVVTIDEAAIGNAGSTAVAPLQTDVHYGIRMRIRNQGSSGAGSEAGTCSHIAINNTIYDHVPHHPYWPGGLFGANHELAVSSLGIEQLRLAPCSLLLDTVTVKFTAAHSNLGPVAVTMEGPGGPYTFDLVPAAAQDPGENWFGDATPLLDGSSQPWDFSTLDPCAYLLKLSVTPLLTTGDGVPDPLVDYIAYCKGSTA